MKGIRNRDLKITSCELNSMLKRPFYLKAFSDL